MEPDGPATATPNRTEGALARVVSRALGPNSETRAFRTPRSTVAVLVCGLAAFGGGILSVAYGGHWLNALSAPLGLAFLLQVTSDFLVGRSPRVVVALPALSALMLLGVIAGYAWAATKGSGLATLALVFGLGVAFIAYFIKKADARHS